MLRCGGGGSMGNGSRLVIALGLNVCGKLHSSTFKAFGETVSLPNRGSFELPRFSSRVKRLKNFTQWQDYSTFSVGFF
jgi:hypothetical protein